MLFGISSSTLFNLIESESEWNPDAVNGNDRGLVQINSVYHPEVSDKQAFDPEFAINFAAKAIRDGTESQWVVCNCHQYVKTLVPKLPKMSFIVPNTSPHVGAVAIFKYGKVYHYAYVTSLKKDGFNAKQSNMTPCLTDTHFFYWDDPHLLGFYQISP